MTKSTVLAVVASLIYLGYAITLKTFAEDHDLSVSSGDTLPGFELPDLSGDTHSLASLSEGKKVVIVNFWATWCPPCRLEMPIFQRLHEEYAEAGLEIIAISQDQDAEALRRFVEEKQTPFTVLHDPSGNYGDQLGVQGLPTTIVLDEDGRIEDIHVGLAQEMEYYVEWMMEQE